MLPLDNATDLMAAHIRVSTQKYASCALSKVILVLLHNSYDDNDDVILVLLHDSCDDYDDVILVLLHNSYDDNNDVVLMLLHNSCDDNDDVISMLLHNSCDDNDDIILMLLHNSYDDNDDATDKVKVLYSLFMMSSSSIIVYIETIVVYPAVITKVSYSLRQNYFFKLCYYLFVKLC